MIIVALNLLFSFLSNQVIVTPGKHCTISIRCTVHIRSIDNNRSFLTKSRVDRPLTLNKYDFYGMLQ